MTHRYIICTYNTDTETHRHTHTHRVREQRVITDVEDVKIGQIPVLQLLTPVHSTYKSNNNTKDGHSSLIPTCRALAGSIPQESTMGFLPL